MKQPHSKDIQKLIMLLIISFSPFWVYSQNYTYQLIGNEYLIIVREDGRAIAKDSVSVFVGASIKKEQRPIHGQYFNRQDTLFFEPHFPFRYGLTYAVQHAENPIFQFFIPYPDSIPEPEVIAISPGTDTVPANLLKIYIHFNQPMSEGYAYEEVRLAQPDGKILESPFVILQPELWDQDRQRLTLWLDPGKIKRGLLPNLEYGGPLSEGQEYLLLIGRSWKSALGQALKTNYHKPFFTGPPDRQQPKLKHWSFKVPTYNSKDKLRITFDEPLDEELVKKHIHVYNDQGNLVSGTIEVKPKKKEWLFSPFSLWQAGNYQIRIDTNLEDLAGNNFNRPFDRDLLEDTVTEIDYLWYQFSLK